MDNKQYKQELVFPIYDYTDLCDKTKYECEEFVKVILFPKLYQLGQKYE